MRKNKYLAILLKEKGIHPDVVAGLLIGTVAGVAVLRGVPVGPLIAAGMLSLLIGINR